MLPFPEFVTVRLSMQYICGVVRIETVPRPCTISASFCNLLSGGLFLTAQCTFTGLGGCYASGMPDRLQDVHNTH